MNKAFKKIWNGLCVAVLSLTVFLAVALVGLRLAGLRPFVVLSGSMEPSYRVGSLIYVKSVDYRELKAGDPITYMLSEDTVATHRIVRVVADENDPDSVSFITKGDANLNPDASSVHYRNIIGKPVFSIPFLGYVAGYIQHPPGSRLALCLAALLLIPAFLPAGKKKKNSAQARG